MKYENFYGFRETGASRPYRGKFDPSELALELLRGEACLDQPVRITWKMGGGVPFANQIIHTTMAAPLIVHRQVLQIFEEQSFTGWKTYPVEMFDKSNRPVPGWAGLVVTGRCGRVDLSRSQIVLRKFRGGWIPHFLGRYFQDDFWDGSDFFMEERDSLGKTSASVMITARVHHAMVRAKVRNIRLIPLNEKCVDCSIFTIGLKHLLPRDFNDRIDAAYKIAGVPRPAHIRPVQLPCQQ